MSHYKSCLALAVVLAFNAHAAGTTLGDNAYSSSNELITIGDNATNVAASKGSIVIGADSHNGVVGRYMEKGKVIANAIKYPTSNNIIGSNSSSVADTLNTIIGNNITDVHRENTLVGTYSGSSVADATSLGYGNQVTVEGGIALGNGSKADRGAGRYGYNAATGRYYTAEDIINDMSTPERREELTQATAKQQQALSDLSEKRKAYAAAFANYKEQARKINTTIFASKQEYEQALQDYSEASKAFSEAKTNYASSRHQVTTTSSILTNAGRGRVSTTGALSIADPYSVRQLTGLAAGSADTDAVNVKQLRDYAAATNTRIEATEERLTTAEGTLDEHSTAISDLTEADKKHDAAIKTLTETDKKHDAAIKTLTETDKKHDAAIEKLDDRSETNKFAITELKKNKVDKADYELDKKNFDEKLDKEIDDRKAHSKIFDKRTKDNQKNIEANKQAIAQTNGKVDAIDNRVTAAEGTIVEHGRTLENHTTRLTTISKTVDRHTVEIDELKKLHSSGMQNINNRINKMDKKLERGLASNAALAGLVQPYNVGKFNVTMALGTYRSTGAIAAGMGYRPTDNLVIRGGIATNTENFQDLSTNIGVGIEF